MDPRTRQVIRLPLPELWDDSGPVAASKGEHVGSDRIREFLRRDKGPLVAAQLGTHIVWAWGADRYDIWKTQIRERLVEPGDPYSGGGQDDWSYVAHEWELADGRKAIVFEGWH